MSISWYAPLLFNLALGFAEYIGWSYGLNGKLAKAPRYQELEGFEKEKNGLFPIHVHIDKLGFIWVNLDASQTPTISWKDDFAGVDEQPRLKPFDFSQYRFDHTWDMVGDYNWKTLADNYNEVRPCVNHPVPWYMMIILCSATTAQPGTQGLSNLLIWENTGLKQKLGISSITTQTGLTTRAWGSSVRSTSPMRP